MATFQNVNSHPIRLPDGEYNVLWTSNKLKILLDNGAHVIAFAKIGVRGIDLHYTMTLENGEVKEMKQGFITEKV